MEKPLKAIFDEIPCTYYSKGSLTRFLSNLNISNKSNFDQNQLKLYT